MCSLEEALPAKEEHPWPVEEPMLWQGHWDTWRTGGNPVRNMERQKETFVPVIQTYCAACCFSRGIGTEGVRPTAKTRGAEIGDGDDVWLKLSLGMGWKVCLFSCLYFLFFFSQYTHR